MEKNQRLVPLFLQEAESNLGILSDYFFRCTQSSQTREDLKAAHRAAHTIKGTSKLVQFKGINQITQHIEVILEKHYQRSSDLNQTEHDILQRVIQHLFNIVDAGKKSEPEPQELVNEALALLEKIEPGKAPARQRMNLDQLSSQHLASLRTRVAKLDPVKDMFAEDDAFSLSVALNTDLTKYLNSKDPFGEDPQLDIIDDEPIQSNFAIDQSAFGDILSKSRALLSQLPHEPLLQPVNACPSDHQRPANQATPASDPSKAESLPVRPIQPRLKYSCAVFELCGHHYHLPIHYMIEIANIGPIIPLPLAPSHLKGLINLRGQVMPVVDLSAFHHGEQDTGKTRRLVIAQNQDEKIAFLAEGIPYLSEKQFGKIIDLPTFIDQYRLKRVTA